jgi:hypothetical protein
MANRFPLIVDTSDSNKIKEIPSGDNLQLSGNNIVGVVSITGSGTLNIENIIATNITKGGAPLASVATSGSYNDLINKPVNVSTFTNDSNYLTSGSNISLLNNDSGYLTTVDFDDISNTPTTLSGYGITDAATSAQGALAASAIQPGSNVSTLNNDAGYITVAQVQAGDLTIDVKNSGDLIGSVFSQDSTIMIDGILSAINLDGTIRGNVIPFQADTWNMGSSDSKFNDGWFNGTVTATSFQGDGSALTGINTGDTIGNFTLSASIIDTDDSSAITITPAVVMSSDLTVENNLTVDNNLTVSGDIITTSAGTPELFSESDIKLTAGTTSRVSITQSPFKLASFTDAQRDALTAENGDMIYNTTNNRPEMYVNGAWKIIDTSGIV